MILTSYLRKAANLLRRRARIRDLRSEFLRFQSMSAANSRFPLTWESRHLCIDDNTVGTDFDAHYTYHPAWAARILAQTMPAEHVDISSILSFSSVVSAFIPIRFYDYRPANLRLDNLTSESADLLALPFASESVSSLSCMHTVEHIGLGRYGDPLDPDADLKAVAELKRVLAPGGSLLFVVPIGKPQIMFNAHRIYSYEQVTHYFSELALREFCLIPDNASQVGMVRNATKDQADAQSYGCGCFWFERN